MKKINILISLIAVLSLAGFSDAVSADKTAAASAKSTSAAPSLGNDFSLGLILGSPTGLSFKYWTGRTNALDGGLGIPFDSSVRFNFHADYLWHIPISAEVPGLFAFYTGVGGRLRVFQDNVDDNKTADFGARIPLGLEFVPGKYPLDFFVEVAPVVVFVPKGALNLDAGVGIRFRFGASGR